MILQSDRTLSQRLSTVCAPRRYPLRCAPRRRGRRYRRSTRMRDDVDAEGALRIALGRRSVVALAADIRTLLKPSRGRTLSGVRFFQKGIERWKTFPASGP